MRVDKEARDQSESPEPRGLDAAHESAMARARAARDRTDSGNSGSNDDAGDPAGDAPGSDAAPGGQGAPRSRAAGSGQPAGGHGAEVDEGEGDGGPDSLRSADAFKVMAKRRKRQIGDLRIQLAEAQARATRGQELEAELNTLRARDQAFRERAPTIRARLQAAEDYEKRVAELEAELARNKHAIEHARREFSFNPENLDYAPVNAQIEANRLKRENEALRSRQQAPASARSQPPNQQHQAPPQQAAAPASQGQQPQLDDNARYEAAVNGFRTQFAEINADFGGKLSAYEQQVCDVYWAGGGTKSVEDAVDEVWDAIELARERRRASAQQVRKDLPRVPGSSERSGGMTRVRDNPPPANQPPPPQQHQQSQQPRRPQGVEAVTARLKKDGGYRPHQQRRGA